MDQQPPQSPSLAAQIRGGVDLSPAGPESRPAPCPAWLHIGSARGFEWNRLDLPVPGLPPALVGLRVLHLSDTHFRSRWSGVYDTFLDRLHDDPPDLLLFTGDLMDEKLDHRSALGVAQRFVSGLRARLGVFGITGNHDGDLVGPRLEGWGMRFMNRRFARLGNSTGAVELVGLPSVRRTSFDPHWLKQLPPREPGVPRILLAHYPDQIRYIAPLNADLMLAGHTHGGQVCLPGGRALMSHDELPKHMARGTHQFGPTTLVVNRGFGMTKWPIRFFCPPEVIEIRLARNDQ